MPNHRPAFDEFARHSGEALSIPVYRQLTGDGLTPVSAFRRIERTAPSFLFESVIGGEKVGRFSFLGTEPIVRFEARGQQVTITPSNAPTQARTFVSVDPFRDLERLLADYPAQPRSTTAACPTSRSRSTTGWCFSTTSARRSSSSPTRT
jgi:anthranilate synthase component 1